MMTLVPLDAVRRKQLTYAISRVLTPAQLTMAYEFMAAERYGRPMPQAEDVLYWMRLNMPLAAQRVEEVLHPAD